MDTPTRTKKKPIWKSIADLQRTSTDCYSSADETDDTSGTSVAEALKTINKVVMQRSVKTCPRRRETLVEAVNSTSSPTKRKEKVTVHVRVVFLKLGEIDTAKETFTADVFIQARWREPEFDGKLSEMNPDEVKWRKYWNPKIYIDNSVGEPKETIWYTIFFNSNNEAYVVECRRVKGSFLENLELYEFPFDTQDLTITLSSERCEEEVSLEQDFTEISTINVQSFVDEQEWRLYNNVETRTNIVTKMFQSCPGKNNFKHPMYSTTCHASRRHGFYVWNVYLVMFAICSMAFTTFSVDSSLSQNRLQLTFILLLTSITFKYVVASSLPKISYLTYLDKYILSSMFIMCAICIWHAIICKLTIVWADMGVLIGLGVVYLIGHIVFIAFIYFVPLRKRKQYRTKEKKHEEKVTSLSLEQFHDIRMNMVLTTT